MAFWDKAGKKLIGAATEEVGAAVTKSNKGLLEIFNEVGDINGKDFRGSLKSLVAKAKTPEEAGRLVEEKFRLHMPGEAAANLGAKVQANFDALQGTLSTKVSPTAKVAVGTGAGLAGTGALALTGSQGPSPAMPAEEGMPTGEQPQVSPQSPLPAGAPIPQAKPVEVEPTVPKMEPLVAPKVRTAQIRAEDMVVPDLSHMANVQQRLADIRTQVMDDTSAEGKRLADAQGDIDNRISTARAIFELAREQARSEQEQQKIDTQWKEVAYLLSDALTNFGAGLVGLKTGKDLSGLKFQQKDWNAEYDRIRQATDDKIKDAASTLGLSLQELSDKRNQIQQQQSDLMKRQESMVGEQQKGMLAGLEAQTEQAKATAEVANKLAMTNAQLQQNAYELQARLDTETNEANRRQTFEELKLVHQAQRDRLNQMFEWKVEQLKLAGKEDKPAVAQIKAEQKAMSEGLGILSTYNDMKDSDKVKAKQDFVGYVQTFGGSVADAEEMLKKADTSTFLNWVNQDHAEAIQQWEEMTANRPQPTTKPTPAGGGMVRVRAPNGTIGSIPASKLDAALRQGYTRAE